MINLYSTNCPQCKVLEAKLNKGGFEFTKITDRDKLMEVSEKTGLKTAPILEDEGKFYSFTDAVKYLKEK